MNCCETDLTGGKTRNIVLTRFEAIMEEEVFHFCCPRFTVKKNSKDKCDCYCFRARVLARGFIQVKIRAESSTASWRVVRFIPLYSDRFQARYQQQK